MSSQEDDSDQPPHKNQIKSSSNYVRGMATLTDKVALFNGNKLHSFEPMLLMNLALFKGNNLLLANASFKNELIKITINL